MDTLNKLLEILDNQAKIYHDLLDISKNKTDIIVEGKVQGLEKLTKVEQTLILKMSDLENQLEKNVKPLVEELEIKEENVTISILLNYLQGENKKRLEELRENIFSVINEFEHVNKLNSKLIQNSLEYINFSINLFSNVNADGSGSYQHDGEVNTRKSSFFDVKL